MSVERYLDILPEVRQAVLENRPVVALESTILSHGMPYPENLAFAKKADAAGGVGKDAAKLQQFTFL